jgi:DNA polymerase III delta prime subunit
MTSELSSLINCLKTYTPIGTDIRPQALGFIIDYKRFVNTLENINNMIGLEMIKNQITDQVKSFIVEYRRFGNPTNKQKLHTLLYGPPGCGKTKIGEYLAELWVCSGCLPVATKGDQKIFHNQPDVSGISSILAPKLNLKTDETEKVSLRQNLAIQTAQLRQCQQRIQNTTAIINNILTQYNNVRKKVKAKVPDHEAQIQAKFQEIKKNLKEINGEAVVSNIETPEILPVTIPKFPGLRSIFGNSNPPLLPQIPNNILSPLKIEEPLKPLAKFSRLTKGDFVGKYQGHTTDQVRKVLLEHIGGVIMIDEVYNLCTSSQDDFGKEALTEINNFMDTFSDKIIFIFAGYRKDIEETVLKVQPGLVRRFNWTFEIKEYSAQEINLIFQQQLKNKLSLVPSDETSEKLATFFKDNVSKFPHFGGDTERLCDTVKETFNQEYWKSALDDTISKENYNNLFTNIDFNCIKNAFKKYLANSSKERQEIDKIKGEKLYGLMYT